MFDAAFYSSALPDIVQEKCRQQAGSVPVVEFRLNDGTALDVCHVMRLADSWLSVAHFRDAESCEDMDFTFLPYESVVRIRVSLHHQSVRKLGFDISAHLERTAETPESTAESEKAEA